MDALQLERVMWPARPKWHVSRPWVRLMLKVSISMGCGCHKGLVLRILYINAKGVQEMVKRQSEDSPSDCISIFYLGPWYTWPESKQVETGLFDSGQPSKDWTAGNSIHFIPKISLEESNFVVQPQRHRTWNWWQPFDGILGFLVWTSYMPVLCEKHLF